MFEAIGRVSPDILGKTLPLNGAGCCGAALADIGIPLQLLRGVVLLARCAGLLGHIAEEIRNPIANNIFHHVESHAVYRPPPDRPRVTARSDEGTNRPTRIIPIAGPDKSSRTNC